MKERVDGPPPAPARRLPVSGVVAALPDFGLAGAFLVTWIVPNALGRRVVAYLMLVMLVEFLIVHSAAFMGSVVLGKASRREKVRSLVGVGVFYTLLIGGFALGFRAWWPLWTFWGLTLNRLSGVLVGHAPSGQERELLKRHWAAGVMLYLMGVFVTTLFPMPAFGITPAVVRAQQLPGGGLWVDERQRVIAFGCIYFTAWGVSELFEHRWLGRHAMPDLD